MSQENVEAVLRGYDLVNTGEPSLELLSPDIEIHLAGVFPDLEPVYRGHAGAQRWLEQSIEAWEEITFETDRAMDLGDRVLVLGHFNARGRDRIEVRRPFANLWTLRNGQAVRMDGFATQAQALEAVGLSEQDALGDLDVIRRWVDAWNSTDLDAHADLFDADAELITDPSWMEAGPFHGRAAIRAWYEGLKESWGDRDAVVLREVLEVGDKVLARLYWQVRGRTSGIEMELDATSVNTIKQGRIVRQQWYFDYAKALEAAGLSEQDAHAGS